MGVCGCVLHWLHEKCFTSLSVCLQGFRLMSPPGCCLEILHPGHTRRTCTWQLQQTLTNCPLMRFNTSHQRCHISLSLFSRVCPSCPNREMSVAASKQANALHQHLHRNANTVSAKPALSKYNRTQH